MKIKVQKVGSIWHGMIEGHPEIDVRGLTEDIARRKVERIAAELPMPDAGAREDVSPVR